jgi:sterol desaturase/sphingolipid hydroxylase (fatty acid hydroxylase superfamily)
MIALAWLAWLDFSGDLLRILPLFAGGVLVWSLAEYVIHRYVFHNAWLLRGVHDVHHTCPRDFVGAASWTSFAIFVGLWLILFLTLGTFAQATVAGMLGGYFFYIVAHHRYHHGDRRHFGRYFQLMWQLHASHHRGGETNFGVSSPLWDLAFGTYRRPR